MSEIDDETKEALKVIDAFFKAVERFLQEFLQEQERTRYKMNEFSDEVLEEWK
jgi:hypothetical protein